MTCLEALDKKTEKNIPMETFRMVEAMRRGHGFSEGNYAGYKDHLKMRMRKVGPGDSRRVYKLESCLSKFLIFKSIGFLRNSLRILRRDKSEFGRLYSDLIDGIVGSMTGKPVEVDVLLKLRRCLLPFRTFVYQIDELIESPPYFFDPSSLKIKHMWNDVEVRFDTEQEKDEFLEGKMPQVDGYDAKIARCALKIERRKRLLVSLIVSKPTKVLCISKKVGKLLEALLELETVLQENLLVSNHVSLTITETRGLETYYLKVRRFVELVEWDESIESFTVPPMFRSVEAEILKSREDFFSIPRKYSRMVLARYLEELLRPKEPTINVPFIPVLFDIAADYISYPVEDRKISELFKKLRMSK